MNRPEPRRFHMNRMLLSLLAFCFSCSGPAPAPESPAAGGTSTASATPSEAAPILAPPTHDEPSEVYSPADGEAFAFFAGGCFWCMEKPFEQLEGVREVVSGYTDGESPSPSYREVSSGSTGHTEAIRVSYDPEVITYAELLDVFWRNIDPTDQGGQFCDRGSQYRTGVFVQGAEERALAEASKAAAQQTLGRNIVTEISAATTFYDAEAYHQDFYRTHPVRYTSYRTGCGRDRRLEDLWGPAAH